MMNVRRVDFHLLVSCVDTIDQPSRLGRSRLKLRQVFKAMRAEHRFSHFRIVTHE
jgi:hypothetical protein